MANVKQIFEGLRMLDKNEGNFDYIATLVEAGSLAETILKEHRMYTEKQTWVVAFSIDKMGNAATIAKMRKAAFEERRQEHQMAYNERRYGKSFTCC